MYVRLRLIQQRCIIVYSLINDDSLVLNTLHVRVFMGNIFDIFASSEGGCNAPIALRFLSEDVATFFVKNNDQESARKEFGSSIFHSLRHV